MRAFRRQLALGQRCANANWINQQSACKPVGVHSFTAGTLHLDRRILWGTDWPHAFLSRLANATALWVRVVGGALGQPAVAQAAASPASGPDVGLAAVEVKPGAAAVAGVTAATAQGSVAARVDGAAGGEGDIAVGVARAGVAVAGAGIIATGAV